VSEPTSFTAEFKARAVLDMLTGAKTAAAISAEYAIPEPVLDGWRETFIARAPMVFEGESEPKRLVKPGEVSSNSGEYEERGPRGQKVETESDSEAAFRASLERSIKENAEIWAELAKH
jgi:transposase-like protein